MFERHDDARAFSRAWAKTGKRIAARMAMIAITTRSSIRVKAERCVRFMDDLLGSGRPQRAAHRDVGCGRLCAERKESTPMTGRLSTDDEKCRSASFAVPTRSS